MADSGKTVFVMQYNFAIRKEYQGSNNEDIQYLNLLGNKPNFAISTIKFEKNCRVPCECNLYSRITEKGF